MNSEIYETDQSYRVDAPLTNRVLSSAEAWSDVQAIPAGEVDTYGATPLDRLLTLEQQSMAKNNFLELTYLVPENVPIEIASRVHDSFGKRFDGRAEANDENFVTSLMYERQDEIDPVLRDMVEKAKRGHASPVMGVRSVELACLTHPYGTKIELLEDMRAAVELSILAIGGDVRQFTQPRYAVKESIGDTPEEYDSRLGLLMTRKRVIGTLSDGTEIRERSSFILRTDALSFLPDAVRAELYAVSVDDTDWRQGAGSSKAVIAYLEELLGGNHFAYAIPISTTAYAFNLKTAEQVSKHMIDTEAERQREWSELTNGLGGYGVTDGEQQAEIQAVIEARRSLAAKKFQQILIISSGELLYAEDL
jgi:hypothetical protein